MDNPSHWLSYFSRWLLHNQPDTATTFKYVEGGPDREAPEVYSMKYQFVYLNVATACLNELDSVCLNGRAGQGRGSLKYQFVYLKVRIFKCSYRIFV